MYRIAICDDDPEYLQELRLLITEQATQKQLELQIFPFASGNDLIASNMQDIDLMILDMEMPDKDGFETAQILKEAGTNALLAFCTGIRTPQPEYFDVHPYCYIMKQYGKEQIRDKIDLLLDAMVSGKNPRQLRINGEGKAHLIPISEILYIDKTKRGSMVHITPSLEDKGISKDILCNSRLSDLFAELSADGFAYAHSSYIVNMENIIKVTENELWFTDGQSIRISRGYKEAFHTTYTAYFGQAYRRRKS